MRFALGFDLWLAGLLSHQFGANIHKSNLHLKSHLIATKPNFFFLQQRKIPFGFSFFSNDQDNQKRFTLWKSNTFTLLRVLSWKNEFRSHKARLESSGIRCTRTDFPGKIRHVSFWFHYDEVEMTTMMAQQNFYLLRILIFTFLTPPLPFLLLFCCCHNTNSLNDYKACCRHIGKVRLFVICDCWTWNK